MASKTEERRAALALALTDAAQSIIAQKGLAQLKARDLANMAGCSLGAIYNVYDDLTALVMAVNGRTFRALGAQVAASQGGMDGAKPHDCLIEMSAAYLDYAAQNTHLWRALFELDMPRDSQIPAWYLAELSALFDHIKAPLKRIYPEKDAQEIDLLVRALFSSIHGIVLLGLEQRISGVPPKDIQRMISAILREIGN
ncbi:MAG: TetR/AcrR family transcriptional regulator [Maritimibacter sp.]